MNKRKRIKRPIKIGAAESLANEFNIGYSQAVKAIEIAKRIDNNESVIQRCIWIIDIQIAINNFKNKKFRKVS